MAENTEGRYVYSGDDPLDETKVFPRSYSPEDIQNAQRNASRQDLHGFDVNVETQDYDEEYHYMQQNPQYARAQEQRYQQPSPQPAYSQPVYQQPAYQQPRQQPVYSQPAPRRTSAPHKTRKKGHFFSKLFIFCLIVALIAAGAFAIGEFTKSQQDRLAEFEGTWQLERVDGGNANPLVSFGSTALLGTTGAGSNMTFGIKDGRAQISTFGIHSEYSFTLDGNEATLTPDDGGTPSTATVFLGKLQVKDASGTTSIYNKTSNDYTFLEGDNPVDVDALKETLGSLADKTGQVGQEALENIDIDALAEQLQNADPEALQHVLGDINPAEVLSGNVNIDDPELQNLIDSVDISSVLGGEIPEDIESYLPQQE